MSFFDHYFRSRIRRPVYASRPSTRQPQALTRLRYSEPTPGIASSPFPPWFEPSPSKASRRDLIQVCEIVDS